ncbi:hypothetical protein FNF31_05678 [Cafeteria roenbergensis]|uniref:Guanylate cyclase domain-containing protein n=1 Tax=Cafeteria roenbergensis TaxID=33653 RepID=A0A5A8CY61_CAFRO|nr:hypothetical protein FNF31_05678 [Cafeteria roenbergensis]
MSSMPALRPTRVGAALSDLVTRRIVIGVLAMLLVVPLLAAQVPNSANESSTWFVHDLAVRHASGLSGDNATALAAGVEDAIRSLTATSASRSPLVSLSLNQTTVVESPTDVAALRAGAIETVELQSMLSGKAAVFVTVARFDATRQAVAEAETSMGRTLFVSFIMALGALVLSHDTAELVIQPVERVIELAKDLERAPLKPIDTAAVRKAMSNGGFETNRIVATLLNVPRLLRVAFGRAGAATVASSLSPRGELDLSAPGRVTDAVVLHVRMPIAPALAAALRGSTVQVLNAVWGGVHAEAVEHNGAVLENQADGCLLCWEVVEGDIGTAEAVASLRKALPPSGSGRSAHLAAAKRRIARARAARAALSCALRIAMRAAAWKARSASRGHVGTPGALASASAARTAQALFGQEWYCRLFLALHTGRVCVGPVGSVHKTAIKLFGATAERARVASACAASLGHPVVMTSQFSDACPAAARAVLRPLARVRPRRWGVRSVQETGGLQTAAESARQSWRASLAGPHADHDGKPASASSDRVGSDRDASPLASQLSRVRSGGSTPGSEGSLRHALQPKASFRQMAGERLETTGFASDSLAAKERAVLAFLVPRPLGPQTVSLQDSPLAGAPARHLDLLAAPRSSLAALPGAGGRGAALDDATLPLELLGLDADWRAGAEAFGLLAGVGSAIPSDEENRSTSVLAESRSSASEAEEGDAATAAWIRWSGSDAVRDALLRPFRASSAGDGPNLAMRFREAYGQACSALLGWPGHDVPARGGQAAASLFEAAAELHPLGTDAASLAMGREAGALSHADAARVRAVQWIWMDVDA